MDSSDDEIDESVFEQADRLVEEKKRSGATLQPAGGVSSPPAGNIPLGVPTALAGAQTGSSFRPVGLQPQPPPWSSYVNAAPDQSRSGYAYNSTAPRPALANGGGPSYSYVSAFPPSRPGLGATADSRPALGATTLGSQAPQQQQQPSWQAPVPAPPWVQQGQQQLGNRGLSSQHAMQQVNQPQQPSSHQQGTQAPAGRVAGSVGSAGGTQAQPLLSQAPPNPSAPQHHHPPLSQYPQAPTTYQPPYQPPNTYHQHHAAAASMPAGLGGGSSAMQGQHVAELQQQLEQLSKQLSFAITEKDEMRRSAQLRADQLRRAEAAAEEQRREAERLRQDKQMLEGELQAERSRRQVVTATKRPRPSPSKEYFEVDDAPVVAPPSPERDPQLQLSNARAATGAGTSAGDAAAAAAPPYISPSATARVQPGGPGAPPAAVGGGGSGAQVLHPHTQAQLQQSVQRSCAPPQLPPYSKASPQQVQQQQAGAAGATAPQQLGSVPAAGGAEGIKAAPPQPAPAQAGASAAGGKGGTPQQAPPDRQPPPCGLLMLPASVALQLRPPSPGLWQVLWTCAGESLAGLLGIGQPPRTSTDPATGGGAQHPEVTFGFSWGLSPFFAGHTLSGGLGQGPSVPLVPPPLLALRSRLQALASAPSPAHTTPWALGGASQTALQPGGASGRQHTGIKGRFGSSAGDWDLLSGAASAPVAAILACVQFLDWASRTVGSDADGYSSGGAPTHPSNWSAELSLDSGDGEAVVETWVCQCLDVLAALVKHTPGMLPVLIGAPGQSKGGWPRRHLQFQNAGQVQTAPRVQGSAAGASTGGTGLLRPLLASLRAIAAAHVDSLPVLSGATAVLTAMAEQLPALTLRHLVGEVLGWTLPARIQPSAGGAAAPAGNNSGAAGEGGKDQQCGKVLFLETQLSNGIYPQRCQAVALLQCLAESPAVRCAVQRAALDADDDWEDGDDGDDDMGLDQEGDTAEGRLQDPDEHDELMNHDIDEPDPELENLIAGPGANLENTGATKAAQQQQQPGVKVDVMAWAGEAALWWDVTWAGGPGSHQHLGPSGSRGSGSSSGNGVALSGVMVQQLMVALLETLTSELLPPEALCSTPAGNAGAEQELAGAATAALSSMNGAPAASTVDPFTGLPVRAEPLQGIVSHAGTAAHSSSGGPAAGEAGPGTGGWGRFELHRRLLALLALFLQDALMSSEAIQSAYRPLAPLPGVPRNSSGTHRGARVVPQPQPELQGALLLRELCDASWLFRKAPLPVRLLQVAQMAITADMEDTSGPWMPGGLHSERLRLAQEALLLLKDLVTGPYMQETRNAALDQMIREPEWQQVLATCLCKTSEWLAQPEHPEMQPAHQQHTAGGFSSTAAAPGGGGAGVHNSCSNTGLSTSTWAASSLLAPWAQALRRAAPGRQGVWRDGVRPQEWPAAHASKEAAAELASLVRRKCDARQELLHREQQMVEMAT